MLRCCLALERPRRCCSLTRTARQNHVRVRCKRHIRYTVLSTTTHYEGETLETFCTTCAHPCVLYLCIFVPSCLVLTCCSHVHGHMRTLSHDSRSCREAGGQRGLDVGASVHDIVLCKLHVCSSTGGLAVECWRSLTPDLLGQWKIQLHSEALYTTVYIYIERLTNRRLRQRVRGRGVSPCGTRRTVGTATVVKTRRGSVHGQSAHQQRCRRGDDSGGMVCSDDS